jgi:hypothetical protein
MKMDHKKQIDEVMDSLDGLKRAEPGPFIYSRILQRIEGNKKEYSTGRMVWLAAASFAVLIVLNYLVIRNAVSDKNMSSTGLPNQGYNLVNINTVNYN